MMLAGEPRKIVEFDDKTTKLIPHYIYLLSTSPKTAILIIGSVRDNSLKFSLYKDRDKAALYRGGKTERILLALHLFSVSFQTK